MPKVLVYTAQDGTLAVVNPSPNARSEGETEDEFLARIAARAIPQGLSFVAVDSSILPESRRFRAHWVVVGDAFEIDPAGAKEQVLAELRAERDRLLNESDRLKMQIDEIGTNDEKVAVADYRQALRDLPAVVEDAVSKLPSIDAIDAFEPTLPELKP